MNYNSFLSKAFFKYTCVVRNAWLDIFFFSCDLETEEMFTFQIILDRLPLPEQTFMGYWTIGQSRNGMQKLLCPTETHHIDIKVDIIISSLEY